MVWGKWSHCSLRLYWLVSGAIICLSETISNMCFSYVKTPTIKILKVCCFLLLLIATIAMGFYDCPDNINQCKDWLSGGGHTLGCRNDLRLDLFTALTRQTKPFRVILKEKNKKSWKEQKKMSNQRKENLDFAHWIYLKLCRKLNIDPMNPTIVCWSPFVKNANIGNLACWKRSDTSWETRGHYTLIWMWPVCSIMLYSVIL